MLRKLSFMLNVTMVRPKNQVKSLNGRLKTTLTLNFDNVEAVIDSVLPLLKNKRTRANIIKNGCAILNEVDENDILDGCIKLIIILLDSLSPSQESHVDVSFLIKSFGRFFSDVDSQQQTLLYKLLGEQLNLPLKEQSSKSPNMETIDLSALLASSNKDLYENSDPRLRAFIEEAIKTEKTERYGSEVAKLKKASFCYNAVENLLKARNLRFVSLPGLSLLTLVYIFSGRSIQTCKMVSSTGAKGTYNIVMKYVLPNSKETSYKQCIDGVTVYYSFDNMQKLARIWRVYGSSQDKNLANVLTSIVHCYPDGLLSSDVQYVLRHSPMLWLYRFENNIHTSETLEVLSGKIIEKIVKINDDDLDIILGRWDLTVENAIESIKKDLLAGTDNVEKMIEKRMAIRESKNKYCEDGHLNEKARVNQKKCRYCKNSLLEHDDDYSRDENDDNLFTFLEDNTYKRLKLTDSECGPLEAALIDIDPITKAQLYPRVRNKYNDHTAIYESEGTTFVNPNNFIRVKLVLEDIQKRSKMDGSHTKVIKIQEDGSIVTEFNNINDVRSWIVVTLDGLPHKIAIDVLKHCFKCNECGKEFTVNTDVKKHFHTHGHRYFLKKFGNIILKIGGLHAEMNMLRSFVSLNWDIYYSYLCKCLGFKSPKAQILQQKVQDMHKSWDTFLIVRDAVIKEVVKLFVEHAQVNNIDESAANFEIWMEEKVVDPCLKIIIQIQKYFGTSIWLYRAGIRANYHKLYRAAIRVFSGLFHINGNLHYSAIEVFDDYLMTSLEFNNFELFEHITSRLCTNLKQEPFCAQSHDARHEESNKQAQNMFPGKDLAELDLAFTIVDDVYKLREKVFEENAIGDRSNDQNVVVPRYEKNTNLLRSFLRESNVISNAFTNESLVSIEGVALHSDLLKIFEISQNRRAADVKNAYRYNDFCAAYNSKSKLSIFADGKSVEKSAKEIADEIKIMIHMIEDDLDLQIELRDLFEKVDTKDINVVMNFLDLLVDSQYQALFEKYR